MKTQITFIIILLLTVFMTFYAQNSVCDKVFNLYAEKEGVSTFNLSGNIFTELFQEGKENKNCKIASIKILTVDDSNLNANLNFYKQIVPNLNRKEYEELIITKSSGQDFVILVKEKNGKITEAIIVSGGLNNSLIYITGSLSMSNLQKVSQVVSN